MVFEVSADIYQWTDKRGNKHYTNDKHEIPDDALDSIKVSGKGGKTKAKNKKEKLEKGLYADLENNPASANNLDVGMKFFSWGEAGRPPVSELQKTAVIVLGESGHGSGVFISETHVLTNYHVVKNEKKLRVKLDDNVYRAKVLRVNDHRDIALLEVEQEFSHPVAHVAFVEPKVGDTLIVIGTPLDISLSNTITRGILSSIRKTARDERPALSFYQTDAALNKGNSGGPVFNEKSELVAISVSGLLSDDGASMNINYLIPIVDALHHLSINVEPGDSRTLNFWQDKWELLKRILDHEIKINIGK